MTQATPQVPRKWRPSLGLIVSTMLAAVLALPLMGVFFFRIYENQLIRQTEAELIAQSAVLAAVMRHAVEAVPPADLPVGAEALVRADDEPYEPILPWLDLTTNDLQASRPDAMPPGTAPAPAALALGERLTPLLIDTQRVTLAGFRVLDATGTVIAGRAEVGLSLAGIDEVRGALNGHFQAAIRLRMPQHEPPPLYSVSRGTHVRVFTAMPVIVRGHVAGVIYASRTPSNVIKHLYEERHKAILAALSMVMVTVLIGIAFHRVISGPIKSLLALSKDIAHGDHDAIRPLKHHGSAEFAALTQGFLDMAEGLAARSAFISTFAAHVSHELKSPLTAIQGAAELLRDETMDDATRQRFLANILADVRHMTAVVHRLRELARAETPALDGLSSVALVLSALRGAFPDLDVRARGMPDRLLRISDDNLLIVLSHLADNAARHGASALTIEVEVARDTARMTVSDDGQGISPNNRARIFDSFFTTRRETGGTGMGLAIVRAMLAAHRGSIELGDRAEGATFILTVPAVDTIEQA